MVERRECNLYGEDLMKVRWDHGGLCYIIYNSQGVYLVVV